MITAISYEPHRVMGTVDMPASVETIMRLAEACVPVPGELGFTKGGFAFDVLADAMEEGGLIAVAVLRKRVKVMASLYPQPDRIEMVVLVSSGAVYTLAFTPERIRSNSIISRVKHSPPEGMVFERF